MKIINMLSKADSVKGQGVGSAYLEQVALVKEELKDEYNVTINCLKQGDITHIHSINLPYFLAIPFAKRKGTVVGYVHFLPETLEESIHLPSFMKKIFYRYVIRFYKSMDLLITVNPVFIDKLAEYGIDRSKVSYIPNFVSKKEFYKITKIDKSELKKKYGLKEDSFTVLAVGQLQIRKGVLDFVEIARKMPDIQFVWAGDFSFGKITDGYEKIKEIRSNPPKNVTFLGMVERNQMNEVYNLADVMFLPSYNELFPMTILESMNCDVPLLLRDLDLYESILFDFYLSGHSNEEFIHLLTKLKTDATFYKEAMEKSQRGCAFYSREHVAKMWRDFYQMALQYKRGGTSIFAFRTLLEKRKF